MLLEVARTVGMTIVGAADVHDPVSLQLVGVTLGEALQRLLGGHSYLLVGDEGADPASFRLVVLPGSGPPRHGMAASSGGSGEGERGQPDPPVGGDTLAPPEPTFASLDGASSEVLELVLADAGADDVAAAAFERLSARDPRDAVRVALRLAESPDGPQRRRALEFLDRAEGADRGEILTTMDRGASDEDDGVRAYALSALALRGGGQSEEILRRELRNPDPDARIVAIQSIAERDPTSVLVRQALADEDPRVAEHARALIVEAGPREEP